MKNHLLCLFLLLTLVCASGASGQDSLQDSVNWIHGPSAADLGQIAQIQVPVDYVFAGAKDTRAILEAGHNPTNGDELGLLAPTETPWFVVFEFEEVGYVRDNEKNDLDADAMLESIRKSNDAGNEERKKRGWTPLNITGWEQKPRYDEATHNLEWAIRGESDGRAMVNFNTRLLGRGGVMRVTLVTNPTELTATLPKFYEVLKGFDFKTGQKYAEYKEGDKVAEYGLAALVVGGASAVAVKTGLFKWIWKGLAVGFVALLSFLKKLFSRKKPEQGPS
jgi:uncharacterized membrane-anchored protein